jgi:hypothetical protein
MAPAHTRLRHLASVIAGPASRITANRISRAFTVVVFALTVRGTSAAACLSACKGGDGKARP